MYEASVNELKELKKKVEDNKADKVRFRIETKHWYGFSEPFSMKEKNIVDLSKYTMRTILNEAINKEKERIDKLIDMEISERKEAIQNLNLRRNNHVSTANKKEMV